MQIKVESVSDVKTDERGTSSKVKSGNEYYYVNEDATPLIGKAVEAEVTEKTSAKGNKYKIAKITKVLEGAAAPTSNGKIKWEDFKHLAVVAHQMASELEPDTDTVDRSAARVAFVQTILVALRDGKIELPKEDGDDNIPF